MAERATSRRGVSEPNRQLPPNLGKMASFATDICAGYLRAAKMSEALARYLESFANTYLAGCLSNVCLQPTQQK